MKMLIAFPILCIEFQANTTLQQLNRSRSIVGCRCYTLFVVDQIAFDVFRLANTKDVELRAYRVRAKLETFPNKSRSCISGQF